MSTGKSHHREVTEAEMDKPSEYSRRRRQSIEIAGEAATMRSEMVRSDPADSGHRGQRRGL